MSVQAIEEILGWRWCARCQHWVPPDLDGDDHATRAYTVDDMAAWLNDHVRDWRAWPTRNPPGQIILSTHRALGEYDEWHEGSSLREAFETAVRAVNGSSLTEPEAVALGVVRNAVGVWEHDAEHGDWQMRLPGGGLGDPETWRKISGNYGPVRPVRS